MEGQDNAGYSAEDVTGPPSELERRRLATEKTLARYGGKVFDWSKGVTCVHLARAHLKNMGHKPETLPRFRSVLGAKKALKAHDWDSVGVMLDSMLVRIAPSQMMLGDLAIVPGDSGLDAIFVCAGPLKVFGWREDKPEMVLLDIDLNELTGAWRV